MEFPETGKHCAEKSCNQLDFLPFTCHHCKLIYCKEHSKAFAHNCEHFKDVSTSEKVKSVTYKCELCDTRTIIEMPCIKCKKHFCLTHRCHDCFDLTEDNRKENLQKWLQPKADFDKAKNVVEQEVSNNLKKAKNVALANKVQLMKLKGRSVGQTGIPVSDRCYFLVYYPLNSKKQDNSKGVFVSIQWTIGKVIDNISELLKIKNMNHTHSEKKLRIFDHKTGVAVAETMDTKLNDLLDSEKVINGQNLVLEYSENFEIDPKKYK